MTNPTNPAEEAQRQYIAESFAYTFHTARTLLRMLDADNALAFCVYALGTFRTMAPTSDPQNATVESMRVAAVGLIESIEGTKWYRPFPMPEPVEGVEGPGDSELTDEHAWLEEYVSKFFLVGAPLAPGSTFVLVDHILYYLAAGLTLATNEAGLCPPLLVPPVEASSKVRQMAKHFHVVTRRVLTAVEKPAGELTQTAS